MLATNELVDEAQGMNDNRLGGIALILGAVSGMITMSLHPVAGAHPITPAQFEKLATLMIGVHVLAIAGVPFSFLGALALARRLDSPSRIGIAGLAIYGLGLVAVMIAPAMSGLVGTEIIRHIIAQAPGYEQWRTLMEYNFLINQAFAKIFVVASCASITLWSALIVKRSSFSIALGIYGLVLGPGIVIAMMVGALRLDVHGFGLIVFCQALWFIVAGVILVRSKELRPTLT
ncbi:MAG: hypothetical protein ABI925_12945 [Verrucomicrobiota bacterium]